MAIVLLAATTVSADYYAVIVGVADYPGTSNDLSYTDDDAIALYNSLLEDDLRWSPDRMQLLVDSQGSSDAIYNALSAFASEGGPEDTLLFFFSGHGTTGVDSAPLDEIDGYDEYLCSYGSSLSEYISDDDLSEWLSLVPMERIIVLLDTCYSGGQIKTVIEGDRAAKSLNPGPPPAMADAFEDDLRKIGQNGIKPQDLDDLDKQIVVLSSSDDDQLSWEFGPPIAHGLFSYYLVEGLSGPADEEGNFDGDVTASEAFDYLATRVAEMSELYDLNQQPQLLDLAEQSSVVRSWEFSQDCSFETTWLSTAGWHMVSIPGEICRSADACTVLGDDLDPFFLFSFDPAIGAYAMAPPCDAVSIVLGKGYWVRTYEDDVPIDANLEMQTQPIIIRVDEGWNQLGNPFRIPVCLSEIQVVRDEEMIPFAEAASRGWVSGYLFPFDAGSGGYQMVNPPNGVLEPWKGYWFLAYSDCDLWIPPAPCPPPPPQSLQRVDLQALMAQGIPTPPPPPMLSTMHESILAESVTVGNTPNPVRSHNTTTFFVSGPMSELVDAILLRIYDLSGVLVYEQEAGSTEIDWHTDNSTGDLLANGVYLYQIWIKSDGVWSPMEIRKVVVLR